MKGNILKKILFSIAIGAIIYIAFAIWADYRDILNALREISWYFIPLILLLVSVNYLFRFLKWNYYLQILKITITTKDSFFIFFSGLSMSITPGKMGELLKCYLLKRLNGTPMSYSSPIIIAERITDFISLIIIAVVGAYTINYQRTLVLVIGLLFILMVILLSSKKISLFIISQMEKIKYFEKIIKKVHIAYESIYSLIKIKAFLYTLFISLIGWFFECLAFYLILLSFESNLNISLLLASFIYSFSTLIGALLFLPGGLGVTDGSFAGLLVILAKVSKGYSVAATLLIRAATLWYAVIIGAIVLIYYQKKIHIHFNEIKSDEL